MVLTRYPELEAFTTKDGSTIRELMHTERQSLAEAIVAPAQATERHYHARTEELYSFLAGSGTLEVDGIELEVAAGDTSSSHPAPGTRSPVVPRALAFSAAACRRTPIATRSSTRHFSLREKCQALGQRCQQFLALLAAREVPARAQIILLGLTGPHFDPRLREV